MPFMDELRDARKDTALHRWRAALQDLRGQVDRYGVERVAATTTFEYLDAVRPDGFPRFKWTPLAAPKRTAIDPAQVLPLALPLYAELGIAVDEDREPR